MPLKLGRDRNWLTNMRDPTVTLPFADERVRERTKRLRHHQIADEIAARLSESVRDELTDDDLLNLGKRVFEAAGEHR